MEWLFWQVGGLGPMAGQNHHFCQYAPERIPYAIDRYVRETSRLYAVLDKRLQNRPYIAGEYSIADMACYPWVVPHEAQKQNLNDYPNVKRWFNDIANRPATQRAYAKGNDIKAPSSMSQEARKVLFGQDDKTIRGEKG